MLQVMHSLNAKVWDLTYGLTNTGSGGFGGWYTAWRNLKNKGVNVGAADFLLQYSQQINRHDFDGTIKIWEKVALYRTNVAYAALPGGGAYMKSTTRRVGTEYNQYVIKLDPFNISEKDENVEMANEMAWYASIVTSFLTVVAKNTPELNKSGVDLMRRASTTSAVASLMLSILEASIDGQISWGDVADLGLDAALIPGTASKHPYIFIPSFGLVIADEFGAFDQWYEDWDAAQKSWNENGFAVLPVNNPLSKNSIIIMKRSLE